MNTPENPSQRLPPEPSEHAPRHHSSNGPGSTPETAHRVVVTGDGPLLVEGPVDIDLPDGRRVHSARPVTAVCVCGRSARYPICDTSHRSASKAHPTEEEA